MLNAYPMKLLVLSICLYAVACGQAPAPEQALWIDFTTWLRQQVPNSKPGDLIRSYRHALAKRGMPETEATRRMEIISNSIFTRRKGVELLWDKVYEGKDPIFLQSPSAIVMSAVQGSKPGRALDRDGPGAQLGLPRLPGMGRDRLRSLERSHSTMANMTGT